MDIEIAKKELQELDARRNFLIQYLKKEKQVMPQYKYSAKEIIEMARKQFPTYYLKWDCPKTPKVYFLKIEKIVFKNDNLVILSTGYYWDLSSNTFNNVSIIPSENCNLISKKIIFTTPVISFENLKHGSFIDYDEFLEFNPTLDGRWDLATQNLSEAKNAYSLAVAKISKDYVDKLRK